MSAGSDVMTAADTLAALFAAAHLPGTAKVQARRAAALAAFSRHGLPDRRQEAWHYTNLRQLVPVIFPLAEPAPAPAATLLPARPEGVETFRLVLVDGLFCPALSDPVPPDGLTVRPLEAVLATGAEADLAALFALEEPDPMAALNSAFLHNGLVLDLRANVALPHPVELVLLSSESAAARLVFSRVLVRCGEGARLTLVETQDAGVATGADGAAAAQAAVQAHHQLDLHLEAGASVDHLLLRCGRVAVGAASAVTVTTLRATLAREAQLRSFTLLADTGLIRRQAFVDLAGPGAALVMSGLSLPSGRDHTDTTLTITHAAPHTTSREVFRHMVDDEATGIFQGRIIVPAVAQKTDGAMSSKAILLSPDASMFSKPELEIFADDVTCAHGATCGALDQDLLFYLMARGLPHAQARAMLLEAFAGDALETIADATLRAHIQAHLQARLAGTGVA